ncbi:MAG: hypothetical protein WA890_12855, partial [Micromonospora sp.]
HAYPANPAPAVRVQQRERLVRIVRHPDEVLVRPLLVLAAVAGTVRWSTSDRPVVGMDMDTGSSAGATAAGEPTPSTGLGTPVASATPTLASGATGSPVPGSSPGTVPGAPTSGPATVPGPTTGGTVVKPSPRPTSTRTGSTRPSPSTSPSPSPGDLCGAPQNPYGYNYCGGSYIYSPATDVCDYFDCVAEFWDGRGYMVQCNDGLHSMTGLPGGPCADHGGTRRPVYA